MADLKRLLDKVDNSTLDEQDLIEVIEALDGVESKYYSIGLALRLRASDLDNIRANHGRSVREAMEQVLKSWLNLNYNDEKFGMPTWRKVVEAAHKRSAGNNHALAKAIAADHPLDTGSGAAKLNREANMRSVNTFTQEEVSVPTENVHLPVSESATEPQYTPPNNYQSTTLTSEPERDHVTIQRPQVSAQASNFPLAQDSPPQSVRADPHNSGQEIVDRNGSIPHPSLSDTTLHPSAPTHTNVSSSQGVVVPPPPSTHSKNMSSTQGVVPPSSTHSNSGCEFVGSRQNIPISNQSPLATTPQASQLMMYPMQSVAGAAPVSQNKEPVTNVHCPPSETSSSSSQRNPVFMDPVQSVTHRDQPAEGHRHNSEQVHVGASRQHPQQALSAATTYPSALTNKSMDPMQSVTQQGSLPMQSVTHQGPLPPQCSSGQELVGTHNQPILNKQTHGHELSQEGESDVGVFVGPGIHKRRGGYDDELDSPLHCQPPPNLMMHGGMPKSPPLPQGGSHEPHPSQQVQEGPHQPHPSQPVQEGPHEPTPSQPVQGGLHEPHPPLHLGPAGILSQPVPCEEVSLGLSQPSHPHSAQPLPHQPTLAKGSSFQVEEVHGMDPPSPPQSMAAETSKHLQESQSDASKKVHYEGNPILFKEIDREKVSIDGGKINLDRYPPYQLKDEQKFCPIELNFKTIKPKKSEKAVIEEVGEYDMSRFPHGLALIINNKTFKKHDCREGTDIDEKALITTFRYLGYTVEVHKDCTSMDMCDIFEEIKTRDHSKSDSFVCCILSHGSRGKVFGSNSEYVSIESLTNRLTADSCPQLANKPKLFFVQACRGILKTGTVIVTDGHTGKDTTDGATPQEPNTTMTPMLSDASRVAVDADIALPCVTDFCVGFATTPGHVSYRDFDNGSWYVSELCKALCQYSTFMPLHGMMKIVNNKVSTDRVTTLSCKQAPEISTRLRKDVFFLST